MFHFLPLKPPNDPKIFDKNKFCFYWHPAQTSQKKYFDYSLIVHEFLTAVS